MNPDSQDLRHVADLTLQYYDQHAEDFWEGTRNHDVSQTSRRCCTIWTVNRLDLGCGPGRDLKTFTELGHVAIGLEGSAHFAAIARGQGHEIWEQNFLKLDLPKNRFDGVFANAALFHVPSLELPRVLLELRATLKPRGVLFSLNPHDRNEESWNRRRYGVHHDLELHRADISERRVPPFRIVEALNVIETSALA